MNLYVREFLIDSDVLSFLVLSSNLKRISSLNGERRGIVAYKHLKLVVQFLYGIYKVHSWSSDTDWGRC